VKLRLGLAVGAAAFILLSTANSGGYRYGISDQAFYIPAIALAGDHTLFPRDAALLGPQMKVWAGDELLASVLRVLPISLPTLFVALYLGGLVLLFTGGVFVARGLGASWLAVATAMALLTLRHRIAKTGANSLEGYMHPRMIAFALGLIAFGFLLRKRWSSAIGCVFIAGFVHPTTALWFGAAIGLGWCMVNARRDVTPRGLNLLWAVPVAIVGLAALGLFLSGNTMEPVWMSVLAEKDYLFPHTWPAYAWALNLLYPVIIVVIYRRRRTLGRTGSGERMLVAGLLSLVAGFLISVPIAASHNVAVVQLQVNRVFWLLDAIAFIYVAWWLVDDLANRTKAAPVILAALVTVACARGIYILHDTGRAFARVDLPADDWTDAMRWIRSQPAGQLVLADPGHAWKYGTSVRVAALHDTVLEQGKDSAMAMYDRAIGYRISDRTIALAGFDTFTEEQFRALARRYGAQLLVFERQRDLTLPRVYQNARFAIYDLR
jgi:hypothetical protein